MLLHPVWCVTLQRHRAAQYQIQLLLPERHTTGSLPQAGRRDKLCWLVSVEGLLYRTEPTCLPAPGRCQGLQVMGGREGRWRASMQGGVVVDRGAHREVGEAHYKTHEVAK